MKFTSLRKKLPEILILVWLLALVFSYLIYQLGNTVPPAGISAVIVLLRNFFAAAFIFSGAAGLGMWLTRKAIPQEALRMFCAPLIGLIPVAALLLIFGLFHLIPTLGVLWLALVALNLLFVSSIKTWIGRLRELGIALFSGKAAFFVRFGQIAVLMLFLLALLIALAPPTQWDSLMYHLSAGKFYIEQGGIVTSPDNYRYSNPAFMLVVFMGLQILAGPQAAAVLMWLFGVWLLVGVAVFFKHIQPASKQAQIQTWLAAGLIFSVNGIWLSMTRAYSDIALMPYFLGAVLLLLHWQKKPTASLLIIAGLLCGSLVSIKYTAFPFCIGLGVVTIWLTSQEHKRLNLKPILILMAAAVPVFLPWMVKNWVLDGNPISPYVWGSPAFDAYDQAHTQPSAAGNPLVNLILLPLQAAVYGYEYLDPFQGSIGPVLVGLLPVIFLFWKIISKKIRSTLAALLLVILPVFLAWTIGAGFSQNLAIVRFYYPMLAVAALLIAVRWGEFSEPAEGFSWRKIIPGMTVAALVLGLLQAGFMLARHNPLPVVLGMQAQDDYLSAKLGNFYTLNQEVLRLAEKDQDIQVLMLWEPKAFYCQPNCIGDDNLNTWQKDFDQTGSAQGVLTNWQNAGFTHILINHGGAEFLLQQQYDRIPPLTNYAELLGLIPDSLTPLMVFEDYGLYQISDE